ncbi:MAG: DUF501 domain-containing protein [Candidatus Bipolaricaulia bacterium]
MERVSVSDAGTIARQIGRQPRGLSGVAARCSHGHPQVIRVHPIVDGEPFPTLYWLTCPYLGRGIDRLEADGLIGRMEDRLAADGGLSARFAKASEDYVRERLALLTDEERMYLERRGMLATLSERGIGGIAERRRIKCLHLHVAHAMARENPVGSDILDRIGRSECLPQEVICSTLKRVEQIERINR